MSVLYSSKSFTILTNAFPASNSLLWYKKTFSSFWILKFIPTSFPMVWNPLKMHHFINHQIILKGWQGLKYRVIGKIWKLASLWTHFELCFSISFKKLDFPLPFETLYLSAVWKSCWDIDGRLRSRTAQFWISEPLTYRILFLWFHFPKG